MSYDLEVATHDKPERGDIVDALPDEVGVSGNFELSGNLLVEGQSWNCIVDGPFRCELDDLAEPLAGAVWAPHWLIQLHVPVGDPLVARKTAKHIATHLARTRRGAVYDPQEGRVVFPRSGKRSVPSRGQERLSRNLKCEWCCSPTTLANNSKQFLSTLERFLPEALPVRFGTFEPLQNRFEDVPGEFLETWAREAASSGSFIWTSKKPICGGGASWPFDNETYAKRGGMPAASAYIELDGDALASHDQWRDAVVAFFRAVAINTGAYFGRAVLGPPSPAAITASDIEELLVPAAVFRGRWHGLPRHPAWLTWLGPPYSAAIEQGQEPPSDGGHLFVQDGNLSAASEDLPSGIADKFCRVTVGASMHSSRERLNQNTSFADALWPP